MKPFTPAVVALALGLTATAGADQRTSQSARVGELGSVEFAHGSAALGPDAELGMVADWAYDHPDGLVVLDGHADPTGPRDANLRLSFARAKAVREKLTNLGVDPEHIVIAAFGKDGPQSTRDRRVVAWGTRAGMKAVVVRSRAFGPALIATRSAVVARR